MNHVSNGNFQYVYVLRSIKSGKWYIGCTNNLRKRFDEHQNSIKKGAKFFRSDRPKKMVFRISVANRSLASQIESRIKKLSRIINFSLLMSVQIYSRKNLYLIIRI